MGISIWGIFFELIDQVEDCEQFEVIFCNLNIC